MSDRWVTSGRGGPWDMKYRYYSPGHPGHRAPGEPTVPIIYTGNPSEPYTLKPLSHSFEDIFEMIMHHTKLKDDATTEGCWRQAYTLLSESFPLNEDPDVVFKDFFEIFNGFFFGGMVKNSVVAEFADDEWKNIVEFEFVVDEARAIKVGLESNLGITSYVDSKCFRTTTIYIRDVRTGSADDDYTEVMIGMLGTLAHEMIHAMERMYMMYTPDDEGVDRADHCTVWQGAAIAIEEATSGLPDGPDWFDLKLDLGRESSAHGFHPWDVLGPSPVVELADFLVLIIAVSSLDPTKRYHPSPRFASTALTISSLGREGDKLHSAKRLGSVLKVHDAQGYPSLVQTIRVVYPLFISTSLTVLPLPRRPEDGSRFIRQFLTVLYAPEKAKRQSRSILFDKPSPFFRPREGQETVPGFRQSLTVLLLPRRLEDSPGIFDNNPSPFFRSREGQKTVPGLFDNSHCSIALARSSDTQSMEIPTIIILLVALAKL
ncbi:hypothetical protein SBOR_8197 [Sclerotinia borealis F-4128]|uniref:SprT-like domain-containing protein n=1 Tax=Sclerotinia borealis (strain F-4128) TaxID=1432307 RepID=W9C6D7_SCLBF|nr:hypothetical protein SBOR_8197 [Sclerotinia borealis F-4128]